MRKIQFARLASVFAVVPIALALTACDPGGFGPTLPLATPSSPSATPSSTPSAEPSASPVGEPIQACELFGSTVAWPSSIYPFFDIQLTNIGSGVCNLTGNPQVTVLNTSGGVVPYLVSFDTYTPPTPATLSHGQSAYVFVAHFEASGTLGEGTCGIADVASIKFDFPSAGVSVVTPIQNIVRCSVSSRNEIELWSLSLTLTGPDDIGRGGD